MTRTDAEVDRMISAASAGPGLRAFVAGLLAENAALAGALGHPEVTHEFVLYPRLPLRCDRVGCARPRDAAVHRTPARVRAELEEQR